MFLCSVNSPQRLRCVFSVVLFFALVLSVTGVSAQESPSAGQVAASRSNTSAGTPLVNSSVPSYVVMTAADDARGIPGKWCTNQSAPGATPDANCSLRDAPGRIGDGRRGISPSLRRRSGRHNRCQQERSHWGSVEYLIFPRTTAIAGLTTGNRTNHGQSGDGGWKQDLQDI